MEHRYPEGTKKLDMTLFNLFMVPDSLINKMKNIPRKVTKWLPYPSVKKEVGNLYVSKKGVSDSNVLSTENGKQLFTMSLKLSPKPGQGQN